MRKSKRWRARVRLRAAPPSTSRWSRARTTARRRLAPTPRQRARNDAILIGVGTAIADDPELTCRLPGMEALSPVRVVLDRRLRLPPSGKLAASARRTPVWLFSDQAAGPSEMALLAAQ